MCVCVCFNLYWIWIYLHVCHIHNVCVYIYIPDKTKHGQTCIGSSMAFFVNLHTIHTPHPTSDAFLACWRLKRGPSKISENDGKPVCFNSVPLFSSTNQWEKDIYGVFEVYYIISRYFNAYSYDLPEDKSKDPVTKMDPYCSDRELFGATHHTLMVSW